MSDILPIPKEVVGIRLCKVVREKLTMCEDVYFENGWNGVERCFRLASVSGPVGHVGKTGDFWADLLIEDGSWVETVALSRRAWNILKNKWAKCKVEKDHE